MASVKPKKGSPVLTFETVEPLVDRFFGNMALIAAALKVSRQAVWEFVRNHPDLSAQVDAEKERVTDLVQQSLVKAALAGESWAVCFYLKCQAKDRGFVERADAAPPVPGADRVVIELPPKEAEAPPEASHPDGDNGI